ncbi:hypothetical protein CDAR_377581 [Caerostris darwini]|uniref:Uncharacterized protein n=1 Tax=Caerostris darwini TaxID=1538125 RepID=A0AAV4QW50_9ARAC|nr:hypothetical protein CDAR_377581 [Caerostris darwini]
MRTRPDDISQPHWTMEIPTVSCVVCVRRFESAVQWNAPRTSPRWCCHRLPPTDTYSSVRLNTLSGIVLNDVRGQGCSSRDVSDKPYNLVINWAAMANDNTVVKFLPSYTMKE